MIKKILTFSSIFFCYVIFAQFAFACDTIQDYISEGVGDNFLLDFAFRKIAEISTTVSEKTWEKEKNTVYTYTGVLFDEKRYLVEMEAHGEHFFVIICADEMLLNHLAGN